MRTIGIYTGSFDPVHEGHIAFASEAARVCGLETVVFMPERFPRGKPNVSPISERITELEFALVKTPFAVRNVEADQFTVDETLTELEALYPNTHFTFLLGSDVALSLSKWPNIQRLVTRYDFVIGMRDGDTKKALENALKVLGADYTIIETEHGHMSSRTLRSR